MKMIPRTPMVIAPSKGGAFERGGGGGGLEGPSVPRRGRTYRGMTEIFMRGSAYLRNHPTMAWAAGQGPCGIQIRENIPVLKPWIGKQSVAHFKGSKNL